MNISLQSLGRNKLQVFVNKSNVWNWNFLKMQSQLEELIQFLDTTSRVELKSVAVTNILSNYSDKSENP